MKKKFKKKHYRLSPLDKIILVLLLLLILTLSAKKIFLNNELKLPVLAERNLPKDIKFMPAPFPQVKGLTAAPIITAKSAVLVDGPSAVVLYAKMPDEKLYPASTTKIMTALVALENYPLDEIITVATFENEGAQMGLSKGDKLTIRSLLYGLLINSGNDAAFVLASRFPGGKEKFIEAMNKKAIELNLNGTHFANENGFTDPAHYTTAIDLARLSAIALSNPLFSQIVSTQKAAVYNYNGRKVYNLENINKLLGLLPGINGVKTGFTEEAGECLVASIFKNGKRLLSVVLDSKDRFSDTEKLLTFGLSAFTWEEIRATDR